MKVAVFFFFLHESIVLLSIICYCPSANCLMCSATSERWIFVAVATKFKVCLGGVYICHNSKYTHSYSLCLDLSGPKRNQPSSCWADWSLLMLNRTWRKTHQWMWQLAVKANEGKHKQLEHLLLGDKGNVTVNICQTEAQTQCYETVTMLQLFR